MVIKTSIVDRETGKGEVRKLVAEIREATKPLGKK